MKPFLLVCVAALLPSRATADTLPEILTRLDSSAAAFKCMSAQMKRLDHTEVINDTSEERGSIALRRTSKGVEGLVDNTFPDKRTMSFSGKQFRFYLPKINTIQIYDVGKRRDQVDQFLVLGFGTSGKELQKAYSLKMLGPDTLNGIKTNRIELTPKTKDALELFQRLELWIPEGGSHAIQQKVHLKGGDYKLMSYTDVKINPPLTDASFDLKAPKNAKKEYIGK
jgi:outer membrane lipoprotein-sorting protein